MGAYFSYCNIGDGAYGSYCDIGDIGSLLFLMW